MYTLTSSYAQLLHQIALKFCDILTDVIDMRQLSQSLDTYFSTTGQYRRQCKFVTSLENQVLHSCWLPVYFVFKSESLHL